MTAEDQQFTTESKESGAKYGYPQCCIDAFVKQTPAKLRTMKLTDDDALRYKMGHLNGQFTGFIPCAEHAKQIKAGKIHLSDLIDYKTRQAPMIFPHDWSFK